MPSVGAPLTREELISLLRLLRISHRNTAKRPTVKQREQGYRQTAKLLSLVDHAPDFVRLEMRNAYKILERRQRKANDQR